MLISLTLVAHDPPVDNAEKNGRQRECLLTCQLQMPGVLAISEVSADHLRQWLTDRSDSAYFAFVRNSESAGQFVPPLKTIKAVSSPVRLEILSLLKDPAANFPPQTDGDLVRDGVCADLLRDKLGIAAQRRRVT